MDKSFLKRTESLPAFRVFADVMRVLLRAPEETNLGEVQRVIEREPAIAARVLSVANSAFYSRGREVTAIEDAVIRLGMRRLTEIVMWQLADRRRYEGECRAFDGARFWQSATLTGACAAELSKYVHVDLAPAGGSLYALGLLHNIGVLVLTLCCPQQMARAFEIAGASSEPLVSAERAIFDGDDHYSVGAELMRQWRLPAAFPSTIGALGAGADSATPMPPAASVLQFARRIVNQVNDPAPPEDMSDSSARLGIDDADLAAVIHFVETEAKNAKAFSGHLLG
jgi:HD-like signal output (HDOD) protein